MNKIIVCMSNIIELSFSMNRINGWLVSLYCLQNIIQREYDLFYSKSQLI